LVITNSFPPDYGDARQQDCGVLKSRKTEARKIRRFAGGSVFSLYSILVSIRKVVRKKTVIFARPMVD
jgi:hypothetical protein